MTITSSSVLTGQAGATAVGSVHTAARPPGRKIMRNHGNSRPIRIMRCTESVRRHAMPATWSGIPHGRESRSGHRRPLINSQRAMYCTLRSSTKLYFFASGAKSAIDEGDEVEQRARGVEMTAVRSPGGSSHLFHRHGGPALLRNQ